MVRLLLTILLCGMHFSVLAENERAVFAGGCFWCMEPPFDKLDGVISTVSGYSGGQTDNPTYESTSTGKTGHYEVVQVEYDPAKISYEKLLEVFWMNIDPFDDRGQFCDKGPQYRAAIFFNNEEQKKSAIESKQSLQKRIKGRPELVTEILPTQKFYVAEDYHQNYYQKNPIRYKYYRFGCGRDQRLKQINEMIGIEISAYPAARGEIAQG